MLQPRVTGFQCFPTPTHHTHIQQNQQPSKFCWWLSRWSRECWSRMENLRGRCPRGTRPALNQWASSNHSTSVMTAGHCWVWLNAVHPFRSMGNICSPTESNQQWVYMVELLYLRRGEKRVWKWECQSLSRITCFNLITTKSAAWESWYSKVSTSAHFSLITLGCYKHL